MNKKALAVAVAAALTAPMAAQAISTSWYGHINRGLQFVDDGVASDVNFTDVTAYSSRMGWTGTGDAGNGVTAGAKFEYDFRSNTSYGSGAGVNAVDGTDTALRIRHAFVWFSGNWGKLSLGQTSDATDGVAYASHNSAWEGSEVADDWGITSFRATGPGGVDVSIGTQYSFTSSYDGGRRDVVRYDSPSFGPVTASVSAGSNSRFDASLRLSTDLGGGSLLGRIGYANAGGSAGPSSGAATGSAETISGSASYKFAQGTFIDFMYGERDLNSTVVGRDNSDTIYVALGHVWGNNSAVIDYRDASNLTQGCDADRIGLGFAHNIPAPKVTLYTGYHHASVDCTTAALGGLAPGATGIGDLDEFHVGARIHFD